HSVYVIIFAISLKLRAFGLLGVFYVDFAGLVFLYSLLMYLYSFNLKRFFYALTSLINLTGLILSQTRNAWLSTFLILLIIILLLSLKGEKFHIKKKTVMILSTFIIFLGLVGFLIIQITTQTSLNRIDIESQSTQLTDNTESVNENSFVSRLFIWHTAINAFRTEPIIGIGMYSFKYTTHKYYTIPKPFFKQFVENKTPHISYLEILVEAGIIGFLGFIYFLFVVFRQSLNLFRANPLNPVNARARLLIIITVFYVIVSMFMTEAWVYGQYLVWFGIILGALIAEQNRSAQNV
ncbi:O-antigen ligase family protein, partial [Ignavibacterium album]|uniref:O-antigen ligase family protein n=1 Tax=Ignavibacterium album TaxID=591197 RepID=UPI0038B2ADBC